MKRVSPSKPPRVAQWLLGRVTRSNDDFAILGDYEEEYQDLAQDLGIRRAKAWYWRQALDSALPLFLHSCRRGASMTRHHLTSAIRRLQRSKGQTLLHLLGLTLGLACAMLILLYIRFECGYDKNHPHLDRLYRVAAHWRTNQEDYIAVSTSAPVAQTLLDHYPQIESAARVLTLHSRLVKNGEVSGYEDRAAMTESAMLDLLALPLIHGDRQTALDRPDAVVLSRSLAMKYFGRLDIVGEPLTINTQQYQVTGVMEDPPRNTHLKLSMLLSLQKLRELDYPMEAWFYANLYTYVRLAPHASRQEVDEILFGLARQYAPAESFDPGQEVEYLLQPVKDIHLKSHYEPEVEPPTRLLTLLLAGIIGLFVLGIAVINYVNLTTAVALKRAREIGIRKALGARRGQIMVQFFLETALILGAALVFASVLLLGLMPHLNTLAGLNLNSSDLGQPLFWLGMAGLFIVVNVAGSLYPALFVSAFQPSKSLKTGLQARGTASRLRQAMVVGQFALTAALISASLVIHHQIDFMKHQSLGFQRDHQIVLPYRQVARLREQSELVRSEYLRHPGIRAVAASDRVPGEELNIWDTRLVGDENFSFVLNYLNVDVHFIDVYGLRLIAGRSFDPRKQTDRLTAMVLNRTAVRRLGFDPETVLGHQLTMGENTYTVIGVTEDFHQRGLQDAIAPLGLVWRPDALSRVTLTVDPGQIPQALAHAEALWKRDNPRFPFEYRFLDQSFNAQYQNEERTERLFTTMTTIGLVIACLGLLGLAAFIAERRTKEIGIRKVLGATTVQLVLLMIRDILLLVAVANLLAWPLALWGSRQWLSGFAYRATLTPWIFLGAALLALAVATLTAGGQALRAALANPIKALKTE